MVCPVGSPPGLSFGGPGPVGPGIAKKAEARLHIVTRRAPQGFLTAKAAPAVTGESGAAGGIVSKAAPEEACGPARPKGL